MATTSLGFLFRLTSQSRHLVPNVSHCSQHFGIWSQYKPHQNHQSHLLGRFFTQQPQKKEAPNHTSNQTLAYTEQQPKKTLRVSGNRPSNSVLSPSSPPPPLPKQALAKNGENASELTSSNSQYPVVEEASTEKKSVFVRFKELYKSYWYVLLPVHVVTSACWLGGFYYLSASGVDIVGILESFGVSERLINPLKDSHLGHVAVAYLLYKIMTPARYTVTLGGTTVTIKYLVKLGLIKPVPTRQQLMKIYQDKKQQFEDKTRTNT